LSPSLKITEMNIGMLGFTRDHAITEADGIEE
jgi:hypothetical protein